MASYTAIADVGSTLVSLLRDRTGDSIDDAEIALGSPGDEGAGDDFRLTVYLYDVRENEHLSNDRLRPESTGQPAGAALVLDLHYLLTAHPKKKQPNTKRTTKSLDQHEVLGRALQIIADNAIVRTPDVDEDLAADEPLTTAITATDRRELLDLWGTFTEVPYQPSVPFVVSPVVIESEREVEPARVLEAEFSAYTYRGDGEGGES